MNHSTTINQSAVMNDNTYNLNYWNKQLFDHYQRFFPDLLDEMRNDPKCDNCLLFQQRAEEALETFNTQKVITSIDTALELATADLTNDLPVSIYGSVAIHLNSIDGGKSLLHDEIISVCKYIRRTYPGISEEQVIPALVSRALIELNKL